MRILNSTINTYLRDATIDYRYFVAWLLEVGNNFNVDNDIITLVLHRCINREPPLDALIDHVNSGIVEILDGH